MTSRRSFLIGIGAALAAPAIVKAESLMKVAMLRDSLANKTVTEVFNEALLRGVMDDIYADQLARSVLAAERQIRQAFLLGTGWTQTYGDGTVYNVDHSEIFAS